ncbi:MAG TPA: CBS domain-containing protein [Thermoanaerobaculia bacterium]|nr:CBS domain-containing protein [Thermoanaerobaculia bacterium]
MPGRTVRDIMTENPAVCTPETTARDAARMMEENDCGSLPVVETRDSMKLIGIVTDRDLALRILGRGQNPDTRILEAMTRNVAAVRRDDNLDEVERLMAEQQVRRIPVVDEDGRILGIIAQADLAREQGAVGSRDFGRVLEKISEPG